jgi:type IV secretory pathway VirJ component
MSKFVKLSVVLQCLLVMLFGSQLVFAAPATPVAASLRPTMAQAERFGEVRLFKPRGAIKSVAVLATGDGRWDDPLMMRMVQLLVDAGNAVIGIDTVQYLQAVGDNGDQCIYMGGDFEDLAHAMEKQLGVQRYLPPILVGYSSGASLVYAVLAQAPRGMFQGGMSVSFCNEMDLNGSLCSARGALSKSIKVDDKPALQLLPIHTVSANWVVLQGEQDQYCKVSTARQFSAQIMAAQLRTVPKVDHFLGDIKQWRAAFLNAYQGLQPVKTVASLPPEVSDLPVTEVPSIHPGDELAILFTGDGGWAELDQELARELSASGVSVVALSSLQYFWQERKPQQAARDLARLMEHYSQVWQRPRIRLLGYSFGADVLPAIVNALPAADRAHVVSLGLLSLLPRTSFEIRVAGWLGKVVGELPVRPELDALAASGLSITCVYGRDDPDSLCRELPANIAQVVALPGGHDCNDDHAAIVRAWLGGHAGAAPRSVADKQMGVTAPTLHSTHM